MSLINDILGYLSDFLPNNKYTVLNKFCRHYYLKNKGIIFTRYSYLPINSTSELLNKYRIIIKLEDHIYEKEKVDKHLSDIFDFIGKNNALDNVRKIYCPRIDNISPKKIELLINLEYINTAIKFKYVDHNITNLLSRIKKDVICVIDKDSLRLLQRDNSWDKIRDWEGKIEAKHLDKLPESIHSRIDIVSEISKATISPIPLKKLTFTNVTEIRNYRTNEVDNIDFPKLEIIGSEYLSCISKIVEKYKTIKSIKGHITCYPYNGDDMYKKIYTHDFIPSYDTIFNDDYESADLVVMREKECKLIYPKSGKKRINLFYSGSNTLFRIEEFLNLFHMDIWYYTDWIYMVFNVVERLEKMKTPAFINLNVSSGPGIKITITDLYFRIISIFDKTNVLIFPGNFFHLMTEPETYHLRQLWKEYFPEVVNFL